MTATIENNAPTPQCAPSADGRRQATLFLACDLIQEISQTIDSLSVSMAEAHWRGEGILLHRHAATALKYCQKLVPLLAKIAGVEP